MASLIARCVISWKTIRFTGTFGCSTSKKVPSDGLSLAILVSGEQHFWGRVGQCLELFDVLFLSPSTT